MLIKCRECANGISETATHCPYCGYVRKAAATAPPKATTNVASGGRKEKNHATFLFVALIVFTGIFVLQAFSALQELPIWWEVFMQFPELEDMRVFVYIQMVSLLMVLANLAVLLVLICTLKSKDVAVKVKAKRAKILYAFCGFLVFSAIVHAVLGIILAAVTINTFHTQINFIRYHLPTALEQSSLTGAFVATIFLGFSIGIFFKARTYYRHITSLGAALSKHEYTIANQ